VGGHRPGPLPPVAAPRGTAPASAGGLRTAREPRPLPPRLARGRRFPGGCTQTARADGHERREAQHRHGRPAGTHLMTNSFSSHVLALLPRRRDYRGLRRTWRTDLLSGLTVGIVALPLALGFGISSGAGAEAGLITAIVAG